MDPNNIVPVTLFLVVGATISLVAYLAWRVRSAAQETLRAAIAAGQQLDERTVRSLSARASFTPEADLRVGIQSITTGIGFILASIFCHFVEFEGGFSKILAMVGIVVTMVGVGNVISWKVRANLPKSEI